MVPLPGQRKGMSGETWCSHSRRQGWRWMWWDQGGDEDGGGREEEDAGGRHGDEWRGSGIGVVVEEMKVEAEEIEVDEVGWGGGDGGDWDTSGGDGS